MSFSSWKQCAGPLMTIGGIGLFGLTVYSSIKETNKLAEREGESLLTLKDKLHAYKGTLAFGAAGLACMVGSGMLSHKQQISLIGAYTLLDQTYLKHKDKLESSVKKILQPEPEDKPTAEVAPVEIEEEQVDDIPWTELQTTQLMLDCIPEPFFFDTSMQRIMHAEYEINRQLCIERFVSVNDILKAFKLNEIPNGDEQGWNAYSMSKEGSPWIEFTHEHYYTEDGLNVCSIDISPAPIPVTKMQGMYPEE